MNNNSILLIDPEFEPATASECSLLVKVGLDSFSYAIINKKTKQINAVFDEQECDGAQKLSERLKNDSYLSLPYQDVKLSIHTANSISVPDELFDETNLQDHTRFFTEIDSDKLYVQPQPYFGFQHVFMVEKFIDELIDTSLSTGKRFEQSAGLLAMAEKTGGSILLMDFTVGSFSAVVLKNKKVIFQQVFEFEGADELNYYVLLMINQLNIDPVQTKVQLSGIVHEGDEKYTCIKNYFPSIQFSVIAKHLDQQILDDLPAHYYSNLLALDQCG